jgi:MinD-like ATPase involved in chromosome partitioning or flagellar assembly
VTLIALASVKGSPGCTTTALALAAAWPAPERLLLEADPGGGDLGPWLDLPQAPGLVGLAAAARHDQNGETIWDHAQQIADGLHVVVAPVGAEQASACLDTLAATAIRHLPGRGPGVTIADCGRLDPGSPALRIAMEADLTLLLVRPQVSDLAHLAPRIPGLSGAGLKLGLLLAPAAGRMPAEPAYGAQEIAATLDLPVHATIPADPRAAARLVASRGRPQSAARRPLLRAAAALAGGLAAPAGQQAGPHPDGMQAERGEMRAAEVTAGDQHS